MSREHRKLPGAVGAALLLAGCANMGSGTIKEVQSMDGGRVLLTSADVRMISQVEPHPGTQYGVVKPKYVTCAEPSPDVAKAVAETSNRGLSLSAQLPQGVSPEVAYAVTRARTDSVAQLGERLATISLLRDALYRACEAYANGALTSTSYAILLSRYDDTMISLQTSELAAGAFGRTLAGVGGETGGKASASLAAKSLLKTHSETLSQLTESAKQVSDIENTLKQIENRKSELRAQREELEPQISQLEADLDEAVDAGDAAQQLAAEKRLSSRNESLDQVDSQLEQLEKTQTSLESALEQTRKAMESTEESLERQFAGSTEGTAATAVQTGGGIEPGKQSVEVSKILAEMQEDYLENINTNAMDVACVVAMDKMKGSLTELGSYCIEHAFLEKSLEAKMFALGRILDIKEKKLALAAGAPLGGETAARPARLSRETVLWIQTSLNKIDSAGLRVSGIIDADTRAAIRRFQSSNGLVVDGIAGPATRARLRQAL